MRQLFLLFFSFFLSFSGSAQQYKVTLAGQRTSSPIPNLQLEDVIDLRYDKTNIGWVQQGLENKKVHADLVAGLKEELKWFLKNNSTPGGNKQPVIIKVNKLEITERTIGDREYGTAEVALEFLLPNKENSGYCFLVQAGSSAEFNSLMDVTNGHAKNLAAALEDCFRQASYLNFAEICATAPPLPSSYLQVNTYYKVDPQTIPIMASQYPQGGVYYNFQQFKNNAPALGDAEVKLSKNGNYFETYQGQKIKEFWGYSDGTQTYVRYGPEKNIFLLSRQKDHFKFVANVTTLNNGAIIFGSLVGGIAGGLIAGALTENTKAVEFTLNPVTGMINPSQQFAPNADLAKTGKIVIFRNIKNEKAESLKVLINDSLVANMPVNSVSEFTFKVPVTEKNICLQSVEKNCRQVVPVLDQVLYFECSLPAKGAGKPVLKPATIQEAEYYLKIIKHYQSKKQE